VRGRIDELTELVGDGAHVAVSANALDAEDADERRRWLELELSSLTDAGLRPFEVDLRADVDLASADLFWATGGNVFVLRRALAHNGFDALLQERVRADELAYGGSSAGACVAGPTLRGIELIDDAGENPRFDGLGFVDYSIAPHAGTEAIDVLVAHLDQTGAPYRALRDGQAIVVHGGHTSTIRCHRA